MRTIKSQKMSIFMHYALTCSIILFCAFLIIACVFLYYINSVTNSYSEKLKTQCSYVSGSILQQIETLKSQCDIPLHRNAASYTSEYLTELKKSATDHADLLAYQRSFQTLASLIHTSNTRVHSIYSYNKNMDCRIWEPISTAYPPDTDPAIWKESIDAANGAPLFLGAMHLSQNDYVFVVGRAIRDTSPELHLGYFLITEDVAELQSLCNSMSVLDSQQYMIVNSNGLIVSANTPSMIDTNLAEILGDTGFSELFSNSNLDKRIDGTAFLFSSCPVAETDWFVVCSVEKEIITKDLYRTVSIFIILIFAIFFTITAVAAYLFYSSVVSPINSLVHSIRTSGMLLDSMDNRVDEVNFLSTSYDRLRDVIEELQSDNYFAVLRRKQLEIELLQVQINPHFLYNTLESIRMMAEIHNDAESSEMTLALSKILRYSIGTTDKIASIRDEIAIIQEYVFLQKIRLDHLESVQIDISREYYDVLIPKLSLQPLVENAIIHGLSNVRSNGRIDIACTKNDSSITLCVSDNGPGIPSEELQELKARLMNSEDRSPGNIGMQNINRRLKLLYGKDYGLRIESVPGHGTTVYMDLPLIERKRYEDSDCR